MIQIVREAGREGRGERGHGGREGEKQTMHMHFYNFTNCSVPTDRCLRSAPICIDTFNSSVETGNYKFNATSGRCERFPYGCTDLPFFPNLMQCQQCNPGSEYHAIVQLSSLSLLLLDQLNDIMHVGVGGISPLGPPYIYSG